MSDPKTNPTETPVGNASNSPAANARAHLAAPGQASVLQAHREVFWQNVVREILNALAATAAAQGGRISATPSGAATSGSSPGGELFDGRMSVITRLGQRIPIADIFPVFSCSLPDAPGRERVLAADVQCTVFQIRTPGGEVFTLPLHEIIAVHSLSEQLIQKLQAQALAAQPSPSDEPFGFAAFRQLADTEASPVAKHDDGML